MYLIICFTFLLLLHISILSLSHWKFFILIFFARIFIGKSAGERILRQLQFRTAHCTPVRICRSLIGHRHSQLGSTLVRRAQPTDCTAPLITDTALCTKFEFGVPHYCLADTDTLLLKKHTYTQRETDRQTRGHTDLDRLKFTSLAAKKDKHL